MDKHARVRGFGCNAPPGSFYNGIQSPQTHAPTIVHKRGTIEVKKPRSNIYELIDVFKREQAATEATYQQLETGVIPPECKTKSTGNWSRGFSRKNVSRTSINKRICYWTSSWTNYK